MKKHNMKILFLSNFFNHHQSALSDALWEMSGGQYAFIEAGQIPAERKKLGYAVIQKPYVLPLRGNEKTAADLIWDADVVITGSAPEYLIRKRIWAGKLVFRYSERPLRHGIELWKYIPRIFRWHWRNPCCKQIYLLCASAHTAGDYAKFGLFKKRAYKWGYFPEAKQYEDFEQMLSKKNSAQVLWCGRFLELKHPDDVIEAVHRLRMEGYRFELKFIGRGGMEVELRRMVKAFQLENQVEFLGSMPPEKVREHMEQAGIYLATSDRQEGWGAVLNESMNSGCAVVASHAIGSVPYLLKDGENGFVYESENVDMLCEQIRYLLEHPEEQLRLGREAYRTIIKEWNAQEAAERLIHLAEVILSGEKQPELYSSGPCSKGGV